MYKKKKKTVSVSLNNIKAIIYMFMHISVYACVYACRKIRLSACEITAVKFFRNYLAIKIKSTTEKNGKQQKQTH